MKRDRYRITTSGEIRRIEADLAMFRATDRVQFRCSPARKGLYERAAVREGISLSKWILRHLDRVVEPSRR